MRSQLQGDQRNHQIIGNQCRVPHAYRSQESAQRSVIRTRKEEPMSINHDDPKWTAYVLGELSETERARLDLELESSQEAREFVQELRLAVSIMKEGLAAHADPALTPEQRVSVQRAALTRPVK